MNWTQFLVWVAGIYALYYLVNIAIDMAASGKTAAANLNSNELSFSEHTDPVQLKHEPAGPAPVTEPDVIASGGVPMNDICNLARRNLIKYTGAVSY